MRGIAVAKLIFSLLLVPLQPGGIIETDKRAKDRRESAGGEEARGAEEC